MKPLVYKLPEYKNTASLDVFGPKKYILRARHPSFKTEVISENNGIPLTVFEVLKYYVDFEMFYKPDEIAQLIDPDTHTVVHELSVPQLQELSNTWL